MIEIEINLRSLVYRWAEVDDVRRRLARLDLVDAGRSNATDRRALPLPFVGDFAPRRVDPGKRLNPLI